MSEKILKALMQLFAIIARPESNRLDRRTVVASFLNRELNEDLVEEYLQVFDTFYESQRDRQKERGQRAISSSSVKVLKICTQINEELIQQQKIIVLSQLLEFAKSDGNEITDQEFEFIETVSDTFNIPGDEFQLVKEFVLSEYGNIPVSPQVLIISADYNLSGKGYKFFYREFLDGQIRILNIRSANMYLIKFMGNGEIYLNGQPLIPEKVQVLNVGSAIRNQLIKSVYFSDIVGSFNQDINKAKISFHVNHIEYRFKNGNIGLYPLSFSEESGHLVGIMGASGAGKSTMLNVLNSSSKPTGGEVLINGINIHDQRHQIEGLIGHVSQDDLLIEELTVYQNLYYNAKLCFDNYTEEQIVEAVDRTLQSLGITEIKDIEVGSPLNKKISGGQRKRLNIALELIREPAVMFLDEPTSGLSSRDSENIMDLLKELSLKGKLIFVVIHQPSSDIFKMFDKLLILDTGGHLIYNGNPIESITYFKERTHHANANKSECHVVAMYPSNF
ncbi:MAG: ATP-binding cassette domain-containing protein, partial [Bacteroidales bacterium]|nr:ATP-binding cassette domain-containing protein [Bacteroidales bacterium]